MPRLRKFWASAAVLLLVTTGCSGDEEPDATDDPTEEGSEAAAASLFGQGCPVADESLARELSQESGPMEGPRVVGGAGDYLLANESAAFVISAPVSEETPQRTWYHYGGIVVDAAAVDGCEQVSPDRVDEIGLVVGQLEIDDFPTSILRAFRADEVQVINDGTDGKAAVVRATGSDDFLQLIEYQLIKEVAADGGTKPLSDPFGLGIEVDYVLEPGDPTLQITLRITAETAGPRALMGAALATWGDDIESVNRPESVINVGGFDLGLDVPWQAANGEGGSYAFAVAEATQAIASISGVQAFIDVNQALDAPLEVDEVGSTDEMKFLLAVSPTDANAATQALLPHDAGLGPGGATLAPVNGTTVDGAGKPVGDVLIEHQMRRDGGDWATYDISSTDAEGRFDAAAVVLTDAADVAPEVRLRFVADGRAPVTLDLPTAGGADDAASEPYEVALGPLGAVDVAITDADGAEMPARITLSQDGSVAQTIDSPHNDSYPVAPGTYDVTVSRGFEYERVETTITVPDDGSAALEAELSRVVDTSGWVAIDTHVHSSPSTDSTVSPERRYLDAAATGLEVIVNTNHELIQDLDQELEASGLSPWVAGITGQEVTASSPEHTTMYPVEPDGSVRGGPPRWYGHDLAGIYTLEKERGASIRGLNHPSTLLDILGWDPVTATPTVTDARVLGLDPDAEVWSWDFEQVELQNGPQAVLSSDADSEGLFDFWQSAFNHGHRITGVAASDAHGLDLGDVMTYVRVDNDDPAKVTPAQIVEAITAGRAVLSTGAFANVEIDGAGPGDLASVAPGTTQLSLRVQAAPGIDVSSVKVFANCDLVADISVDGGSEAIRFDGDVALNLPADANITVLGFGTAAMPVPFHDADPVRVPRFTTNPIFVDVDGNGEFDPPGDKSCSYPRS